MKIHEYRITMPMTLDEYEVGLLFTLAQAHKRETGGGEGVVIVKNEPYENFPLFHGKYSKGQYTYKIYHEESKMPKFIRLVAPPEALVAHEESWNAFPHGKLIYSNPKYMKGNCWMEIDTFHTEDRGESENVYELDSEELESRSVIHIDIANDPVDEKDYVEESDPTKFKSKKTGRGLLTGDWIVSTEPVMTAYIIVKVFLGGTLGTPLIASQIENFAAKVQRRLFLNFYRNMFCSIDEWHGLTMEEIRVMEEETRLILYEEINKGEKKPFGGIKSEAHEFE